MASYELAAMMVVIVIAACIELKKYSEPKK